MYTIIDIETTGNGIKGNKITEIAIYKYNGLRIVDEYATLVNPQCPIPQYITGLTGIDDAMVENAPIFPEVAERILAITEGTIFVAHSVNFDYNVIKNEFKEIGRDFTRKKLCTVRLSRSLFPGYHSYSLGKLCTSLNIPLYDRHRASGDAKATVLLFEKILQTKDSEAVVKKFLNARSQEGTLPPGLPKDVYDRLPAAPGVYYFRDASGKIIYVGKAINIKKRVLGHFYDKSNKEIRLCSETTHIDFEPTGSELLALLMESSEIKKHFPKYNSAQKHFVPQYGIFSYEDRGGIRHIAFNKIKLAPGSHMTFTTPVQCREYLEMLCDKFNLCPKYCHLQENVPHCSHYRLSKCDGICKGTEPVEDYNKKVTDALAFMNGQRTDFMIRLKGRRQDETAFVLVREDVYLGYGFVDNDVPIITIEDLEPFLIKQKNTPEVQSILRSFMPKLDRNIAIFSSQDFPVSDGQLG